MSKIKLTYSIVFTVLCIAYSYAQEQTTRLKQDQLKPGYNYLIDTIINGTVYFKVDVKSPVTTLKSSSISTIENTTTTNHTIPAKQVDTITRITNTYADAVDKKWLNELYNNSMFDTIYRDVVDMEYDMVYFPELPTDTLKARLKRLNAKTPFNVEYSSSLESVIKMFLKNRPRIMERQIGLSKYYFPMFEREMDNYDIPLEMKYLAVVESALKPRAKSRVGATGLWQFMYATGKQYGLNVSSYVDERCAPVRATKSAARYLSRLYKIFGDWDLALAAYNSGPGNVSKAIRRSGGYKNYWNLRPYLPRETAGYVPAFLATMYIFEYAKEHGLVQHEPKFNYVETDTIVVKQTITLDQVSEYTGVKMEELQFLNPAYKLDIIPYIKGKNYTLRLPQYAIGDFVSNEESIYARAKKDLETREKPLPELVKTQSKTYYRVRKGDYLGKIARRYGVRVSQLKRWNGLRSNTLRVGQKLTIYSRSPVAVKKQTPKTNGKNYKVRSGDTLWSIAQKFPGVSVQNLKDWNNIGGSSLRPGMVLKISK